jgi:hypothetical protein
MLAAKYLSCEAGIHNMIALKAMQLRKTTQQVGDGDCVLPCSKPGINRVDPLLFRPAPERLFALGHLPQKEEQNILPFIRANACIVERVIQWPNQAFESRPEVHRTTIAIEPVRFRIERERIFLNRR